MSDLFGMSCAFVAGVALSKLASGGFYYFKQKRKIHELKQMADSLAGKSKRLPTGFKFMIGERKYESSVDSPTFTEDCKELRLRILELIAKMENDL